MNKDKMSQSLLIGALTSSFGIFISKLLGLFYYSPLSALAGESNMVFYSIAYTYYDILLQISSAGIPFAIASLVAKYGAKKDYKTVLLIKKLGTSIIMGLSFVVVCVFLIVVSPLSRQLLGVGAPQKDIENLKTLFYILMVAVIAVPFLSSIRGYVQGLKRLDIYASSQVLEQFIRVFTIIIGGYVFVKLMNFESMWAIYVAIAAASIGAIFAIVFTLLFSRKDQKHVEQLAKDQQFDQTRTVKEIFNEVLTIGIPYVVISFLSTAGPIVNTTFFMDYITKILGVDAYESAKLTSGILQGNIAKISNIPSVLALGFGSGMVPYLSESLEENDNHKITRQINQILDTVTYILVPLTLIFVFFARDIYYIMYGNTNLDMATALFKVSNIQIFLGTIAPVFSSIMMSLRLKKEAIITLIVSFIVKLITFFPCVRFYNTYGMIYSSGIYYLLQILMYFYYLRKNFSIDLKGASKRLLMISACSIAMIVPVYIIHQLIGFDYTSRIYDICLMGGLGILMLINYYIVSVGAHLPQKIFGIEDITIKKLLKRFRP